MITKLTLDLHFPSVKLIIPEGAVSVTQFLQHGDHPKVKQDYESSFGGDINIDSWFIDQGRPFLKVVRGDWIFDMADGTCRVLRSEHDHPSLMLQKATQGLRNSMKYST